MSRTYRTHLKNGTYAYGRFWTRDEEEAFLKELGYRCSPSTWSLYMGWGWKHYIDRKSRDEKPWYKPCKEFKRMRRQGERAQVKDAMAKGKEIPFFRKGDIYDWT
jgi:hypothetical protein